MNIASGSLPCAVREYVAHGHRVLVDTDAGAGIGANDDAYRAAGAEIPADATEVCTASSD
jgi:alanine dehydrogenase